MERQYREPHAGLELWHGQLNPRVASDEGPGLDTDGVVLPARKGGKALNVAEILDRSQGYPFQFLEQSSRFFQPPSRRPVWSESWAGILQIPAVS